LKRLVILALAAILVLGVVGTAAAEGGSIVPWSARSIKVKPMEGGSIVPW